MQSLSKTRPNGRPYYSQADEDAAIQIQLLTEIKQLLQRVVKAQEPPTLPDIPSPAPRRAPRKARHAEP